MRAAIEPPDYPPQFDLMRYAAMREKVNYAVNERLNIYTPRGVGGNGPGEKSIIWIPWHRIRLLNLVMVEERRKTVLHSLPVLN